MREEFAKLKLKDDRRKKRRREEITISKDSTGQNPKKIKEKKIKSNKRKGPSYEHKKESDSKLAVLQPYPLRNDCRIALGLRNIVPKAPKGKVFLAPAKIEAASKKSSSIVGVKKQKPPQSSIDHGNKGKSGEGTKKMLSVTPCDLLPSETQDSSSAPPLGYRKEAGRKTVRVRNENQTRFVVDRYKPMNSEFGIIDWAGYGLLTPLDAITQTSDSLKESLIIFSITPHLNSFPFPFLDTLKDFGLGLETWDFDSGLST